MPKESFVLWKTGTIYEIRPKIEEWRIVHAYDESKNEDAKFKAQSMLFYLNNDKRFDSITHRLLEHLQRIGQHSKILPEHFPQQTPIAPIVSKSRKCKPFPKKRERKGK